MKKTFCRLLRPLLLIAAIAVSLQPVAACDSESVPVDSIPWNDPRTHIDVSSEEGRIRVYYPKRISAQPDSAPDSGSSRFAGSANKKGTHLSAADSLRRERNWWRLLRKGQLDMKDTTVVWPRFLGFCVKVYNWGDRVFNSYDSDYVEGTGKRWKAFITNDTWMDSYALHTGHSNNILMSSDGYDVLSGHLSYMAVGLSYSLDLTNIIGNKPLLHKKMDLQFSCARFSADAYYNENTGGTFLRRFCDYKQGEFFKYPLEDMKLKQWGIDVYYFLNNRRYSQGAAYNFSKLQRRSAGSLIFGISVSNIDLSVDFSRLPAEILKYYTYPERAFNINYNDYCLIIGYGYNWVFARNFLFNASILPMVGYKHMMPGSFDSGERVFSIQPKGKMSVTYNLGNIFFSAIGKFDSHWFLKRDISIFSTVTSGSLATGVRF